MIAHAYIANTQYIPNALGMADTLGDRIREQRDKLGMSQAALGDAVGVRQPTMWRYEASRLRPSADALDRIATALGVTSRWLLHGEEEAAPVTESRVTYDRDEAIDAAADSAKLDDEQRARLYDACRSIGPMSAGELLQTAERIARNARTAGLAHPMSLQKKSLSSAKFATCSSCRSVRSGTGARGAGDTGAGDTGAGDTAGALHPNTNTRTKALFTLLS